MRGGEGEHLTVISIPAIEPVDILSSSGYITIQVFMVVDNNNTYDADSHLGGPVPVKVSTFHLLFVVNYTLTHRFISTMRVAEENC